MIAQPGDWPWHGIAGRSRPARLPQCRAGAGAADGVDAFTARPGSGPVSAAPLSSRDLVLAMSAEHAWQMRRSCHAWRSLIARTRSRDDSGAADTGPGSRAGHECVDASGGTSAGTYIGADVPDAIAGNSVPWPIAGAGRSWLLHGGFCRPSTPALHYPSRFSAAAACPLFPADHRHTTGNLYQGDTAAKQANTPLVDGAAS